MITLNITLLSANDLSKVENVAVIFRKRAINFFPS